MMLVAVTLATAKADTLLTQASNGIVSVVKGLTSRECEAARSLVLREITQKTKYEHDTIKNFWELHPSKDGYEMGDVPEFNFTPLRSGAIEKADCFK